MGISFRVAVLVIAASVSACANQYWRGSRAEPCNLLLINDAGSVHVSSNSSPSSTPELTGNSRLKFESVTSDGKTTLTVLNSDKNEKIDVRFLAPAHCGVEVETRKGNISVDAGSGFPSLKLNTITGNIALHVASNEAAEIRLATSGEITTDYTIDIEYKYHEEPSKYGRVATGKEMSGSASDTPMKIQMRSLRGDVSVLRPDQTTDGN